MKKLIPFLVIFLLAVLLIAAIDASAKSASGKKTVVLTYKMSPGLSFTMKTEGSTEIKTDQMGQVITVEMNSSAEALYHTIDGTKDGIADIEQEYKAMKQSAKSTMGENETDFSSWIGKKVQFNLSQQGALSNFRGFDLLPEITSAVGEKVNGDLIRESMKNQFFELPDHPVKIGESWTVKTNINIPYGGSTLKQEENTIYKASEKVEKNGLVCLKIDFSSTAKLTGVLEQQGNQLELTRDTKSTGTIWFALEKGMYISMEVDAAATGQIYVPAASVTIPQEIKSKMAVAVVFK
ncbi:MAG: DUF6263 family protein [Bacteroidia bacterium]|nr:DUF6263 family protein [Bacteroidia bacterium]